MSCHQGPGVKNLSEVLVTESLGMFTPRDHPDSHSQLSQKAKGYRVHPSKVLVMFAYLLASGRRTAKANLESRIPKSLDTLLYPTQQEQPQRVACGGASLLPGGARSQKSMHQEGLWGWLVQECLGEQFPFVTLSAM